MSNLNQIFGNRGVGLANIKTDEKSLIKALQKLELLWTVFMEGGLSGYEVIQDGNIVTHDNQIVYHVPAPVEILIELLP